MKQEVFSKFRLSVDNKFRNEYSYIDYRRWGVLEVWTGNRVRGEPPKRQQPEDRIEVWFNWELLGLHKSYEEAEKQIKEHLALAPVPLDEFLHYLKLR